jgi:2-keto-4-pentenoate hydratase
MLVERLLEGVVLDDCGSVRGGGGNVLVAAHLAFVLERRLGPGADERDVLRATAAVLPALRVTATPTAGTELVRSRGIMPFDDESWRQGGAASTLACVIGDAVLDTGDLDDLLVTLKKDGVVVAAGEPTEMQLPPVAAVAWLAAHLHSSGEALSVGAIILSGALHMAVPVAYGHHVRADMLGVGSVCAHVGP